MMMGGVSMYEKIVEIIKSKTGLTPTAFLVILTLFILTYNFVSSFFVYDVNDDDSKSTHVQSQQPEAVEDNMKRETVDDNMKRETVDDNMKRETVEDNMKRETVDDNMKRVTVEDNMKRETVEDNMKRETVEVGPITPEQLKSYDGSDSKKPLLMAIKGQIYDVSLGRMFYGPGGPYSLFAGRDATRALALMSFDPLDLNSNTDGLTDDELDVLHDWELKFSDKYPIVGTLLVHSDQLPLESKKFV